MKEQMSLEEYKKKVEECLLEILESGEKGTQQRMKDYEEDFQQFLEENWEPRVVAYGMVNYFI